MEIKLTSQELHQLLNGEVLEPKITGIEIKISKKESFTLPENKEGWYVSDLCYVNKIDNQLFNRHTSRNVFATKEQAEASMALAQLSQLLKVVNGDWVPDWTNEEESRVSILFYGNKPDLYTQVCSNFLVFKDKETAKLFLEQFHDLIIQAKPLL